MSIKGKKKLAFYVVGISFLLYLIVFHQAVFMYHDDYGYATLTYGYTGNVHGIHWDIWDLLKFVRWHYMNWGGRVFYFFFYIVALRLGENYIQAFQALVFFMINVALYKSFKRYDNDVSALIVVIAVWFSIGVTAATDGMLWYTASAIYVWPFLAFFSSLLSSKSKGKKMQIISGVLLFCAGFSQEQIAILVIVYSLCKIAELYLLHGKGFGIYFSGIVGSIVLIAAPGNWIRVGENTDFYGRSFIDKVIFNVPRIIDANFNAWIGAREVLYIILLCYIGVKLTKQKYLTVINVLVSGLSVYGIFKDVTVLELVFAAVLAVELFIYLIKTKKMECLYVFLGACATQAMMVMSPVVEPRVTVPFFLAMNYVAVIVLLDMLGEGRQLASVAFGGFCLVALINTGYITRGYYENYNDNVHNKEVLTAASESVKSGDIPQTVSLNMLKDDFFSGGMPYKFDYIKYWMKNYYEIPQDVEFVWSADK